MKQVTIWHTQNTSYINIIHLYPNYKKHMGKYPHKELIFENFCGTDNKFTKLILSVRGGLAPE